jgi:hypothetical protein
MVAEAKKTLWDWLGEVEDRREAQGRRYGLQSILGLAVGAALGGNTTLYSIAQWVDEVEEAGLLSLFGIEREKGPCQSTFHYVFIDLDIGAFERALSKWVADMGAGEEMLHMALDGKAIRGSASGEYAGVHLITMYSEKLKGVLSQFRLPPGTNEIKAAAKLLKAVRLDGVIVTGDAIFTQKKVCRTVVKKKGDYFFAVKENQPQLLADVKMAFETPVSPLRKAAVAG